ncbi:MAG: glycogen/starch synthase [Rikenellaceae bacterium]
MTKDHKILYVCQEVDPYVGNSVEATRCKDLLQAMHERRGEIRTFMPRYGTINDRRNQLHEVIRLSGMNLIINDTDHQLIIKVASIPSARVQVYFIDNEDYFSRRARLVDESGVAFEDNDERALFFARGVLETVKKLRWEPSVIQCQGWFSALTALYLRHTFHDDPIFANVKIVMALDGGEFEGSLDSGFAQRLVGEGLCSREDMEILSNPTYENYCQFVLSYADGVVISHDETNGNILKMVEECGKPVMKSITPKEKEDVSEYYDNYAEFYDTI